MSVVEVEVNYSDVLNAQVADKITNFKYQGHDASILYEHFISPIEDRFVVHRRFPLWLAPNIITLVGFAFIVVPHIWILNRDTQEASGCHFMVCGICILLYSLCDNTDGKQARKTGSSSSLGMILDHGCDAVTCCLLTISIGSLIGVEFRLLAFLLCTNTYLYFLANLEQYFTDYLYLPRINAVSEGLWGIAIVMTLSPLLGGYSFWTSSTFGIQHNRFLVFLPIFTFGYNVQMHLSKILKKATLQSFLQASLFAITLSTLTVAFVLRAETPSRVVLYTQGHPTLGRVSK